MISFSIRKNAKKLDGDGNVQSRRWFCSREGARLQKWLDMGNRKREPKSISRCECKATFRIRLIKQNSRYEVAEFVKEHNHSLVPPPCVPFLWSQRKVGAPDKAQVSSMRRYRHLIFSADRLRESPNLMFLDN